MARRRDRSSSPSYAATTRARTAHPEPLVLLVPLIEEREARVGVGARRVEPPGPALEQREWSLEFGDAVFVADRAGTVAEVAQ